MHVALLRGINLGARNRLPMKGLVEVFQDAGCRDVSTFIQSGNIIFNAPKSLLKKLPRLIEEQLAARFDVQVPVVLRSSEELAALVNGNPYLQAGEPEKTLHVLFLADLPDPTAVEKLDAHRSPGDRFHVSKRDVYLHLPIGLGRSKLTNAYFDSKLSTKSTARNWAPVLKLLELSSRL